MDQDGRSIDRYIIHYHDAWGVLKNLSKHGKCTCPTGIESKSKRLTPSDEIRDWCLITQDIV